MMFVSKPQYREESRKRSFPYSFSNSLVIFAVSAVPHTNVGDAEPT